MNTKIIVLAALIVAAGLLAYGTLAPSPAATFALEVPDKGLITYTCRLTSTEAEAKTRAEAAHRAFQSRLRDAAVGIATQMQDAMVKANNTGDRSYLQGNVDLASR